MLFRSRSYGIRFKLSSNNQALASEEEALTEVFGLYTSDKKLPIIANPDLSLDFVVPLDLIKEWKRCSIVANFFANYQSFNFKNKTKSISILSTITNELLENSIKFSSDKNKLVSLSIRHFNHFITIETVNLTDKKSTNALKKFLKRIETTSDIANEILYQLEQTALTNSDISGLGLMSLIHDYHAELGVKIELNISDSMYDIYVKIKLNNEHFE